MHLKLHLRRKEAAIAKAIDIMQWLRNVQPPDVFDVDMQVQPVSDRERELPLPTDDEARLTPVPNRRSKKPLASDSSPEQNKSQPSTSRRQASRDYVLSWLAASFPPTCVP